MTAMLKCRFRAPVWSAALGIIVLAVAVPAQPADEVLLECKYVPGQKLLISGEMNIDGTVTMEGLPAQSMMSPVQGVPIEQTVAFESVQTVEEVDPDGVATLSMELQSMRSENVTAGKRVVTTIDQDSMKVVSDGKIVMDTSQPGETSQSQAEMAQLVEQFVKDVTTVKVAKDGSILEVTGGNAAAVLGQGAKPDQWSRINHISLPEGPVTVGSTWEASQDLASALGLPEGKGVMQSTCTIESIEVTATDLLAHIRQSIDVKLTDWSPEVTVSAEGGDAAAGMPQMKFDELTVTGVIKSKFAVEAGRLVGSRIDINQHMKASVDSGPAAQMPAGSEPVHMVTDTHMVGAVETRSIEP